MKKVIGLLVVIAALFIGGLIYADISNKKAAEGNPYGKQTIHPATAEQLKDPLYDNQILPDQLSEKLSKKEDVYVYFYSPLCDHCQRTTPVLVPMAKELQIDMKKLNVLEFDQSWDQYKIDGTPTLIYFKDGVESKRIVGEYTAEEFRTWFKETAKKQ